MTQEVKYTAQGGVIDTTNYGYNDGNEQTSMTLNNGTPETRTYDAWGRLATRTQGSSSATYGYRYGGKLHSAATNFAGETGETLDYRGDGRLHTRTWGSPATTRVYRYDRGWNAVNEEDGAGALVAASVYSPDEQVGERLAYSYGPFATGTTVYAYHDQLGSVRRWRLANKNNWGANEYQAFGKAYSVSTLAPQDYALHEWDANLAMFRAPYRNYSPAMARWTTEDPLGMVAGPNMYGYVRGNTISSVDEMGLIGPIGLAWLLLRLGVGLQTLNLCLECLENAQETDQLARRGLCYEDYIMWRNNANPGQECYLMCGISAALLAPVIIQILIQIGKL